MEKLSRRDILKRAFFASAGLLFLDAVIEPRSLALRRVEFSLPNLPPSFDGYKIGILSDIHYPRAIKKAFIRSACQLLMETDPDVVVIPGDFVDGKHISKVPSLTGLFDDLTPPDGVFGVLGNHDHWLDEEGSRRALAEDTPVQLIENQHVLLEREGDVLALGGVGDLWEGIVDPASGFEGVEDGVPRILLSHNPDLAEEAEGVQIDLQISGHTHGEEVATPWGAAPFIPSNYGNKFRYGFNQGKSHMCFTTSGITSPRRVRLFCRPEVVCLTLKSG